MVKNFLNALSMPHRWNYFLEPTEATDKGSGGFLASESGHFLRHPRPRPSLTPRDYYQARLRNHQLRPEIKDKRFTGLPLEYREFPQYTKLKRLGVNPTFHLWDRQWVSQVQNELTHSLSVPAPKLRFDLRRYPTYPWYF